MSLRVLSTEGKARRERPVLKHDAMAGRHSRLWICMEGKAYKTCVAWTTYETRDLAIARNAPSWDLSNHFIHLDVECAHACLRGSRFLFLSPVPCMLASGRASIVAKEQHHEPSNSPRSIYRLVFHESHTDALYGGSRVCGILIRFIKRRTRDHFTKTAWYSGSMVV